MLNASANLDENASEGVKYWLDSKTAIEKNAKSFHKLLPSLKNTHV